MSFGWLGRLFIRGGLANPNRAAAAALALALSACTLPLPDKPARAAVYDFGPGVLSAAQTVQLPPIALGEVDANPALDSTAMLYRLAYSNVQQLRPYAQARWSMAPPQLLRQRLSEYLSQRRPVVRPGGGLVADAPAGVAGPATGKATGLSLRIELDEFSQLFESATSSVGLLRLRATVVQATAQGDKLVAQKSLVVQRPASSADAPGGVQALAAATDAAIVEIDTWLQQLP